MLFSFFLACEKKIQHVSDRIESFPGPNGVQFVVQTVPQARQKPGRAENKGVPGRVPRHVPFAKVFDDGFQKAPGCHPSTKKGAGRQAWEKGKVAVDRPPLEDGHDDAHQDDHPRDVVPHRKHVHEQNDAVGQGGGDVELWFPYAQPVAARGKDQGRGSKPVQKGPTVLVVFDRFDTAHVVRVVENRVRDAKDEALEGVQRGGIATTLPGPQEHDEGKDGKQVRHQNKHVWLHSAFLFST